MAWDCRRRPKVLWDAQQMAARHLVMAYTASMASEGVLRVAATLAAVGISRCYGFSRAEIPYGRLVDASTIYEVPINSQHSPKSRVPTR